MVLIVGILIIKFNGCVKGKCKNYYERNKIDINSLLKRIFFLFNFENPLIHID
ncbi:hypothetical protein TRIP_C21151 [Candidatus Zixiibacteriota bacterium]|nr:hypothetical protein TRIP_C21151 [candidate division Zixibacteria bacterium]